MTTDARIPVTVGKLAAGAAWVERIAWCPVRDALAGTVAVAQFGAPVSQLRWSADDQALAVGAADGKVVVYSLK
jgi:hypothetical protein